MAPARARPSKVEVPRPISSISTSECSVAAWMMAAASVISSMKVDWALARSSAAPMRVWMASMGPRRQAAAVGDEGGAAGFHQAGFGHRVAALLDLDAGMGPELGPAPAQGEGALG